MKNKKLLIYGGGAAAAIIITLVLIFTLGGDEDKWDNMDSGFYDHVSSFTEGTISREASIRVTLSADVQSAGPGSDAEGLFDFDPAIEGTARWLDKRTVEFVPEGYLPSGQDFKATFHVDKVKKDVPDKYAELRFSFSTIKQDLSLSDGSLYIPDPNEPKLYIFSGTILSADIISIKELEQAIQARQKGKALKVTLSQEKGGSQHQVVVEGIERADKRGSMTLSWDGSKAGFDFSGKEKVEIPATDEFELMEVQVKQYPEQYVKLVFSDPLAANQYMEGLVHMAEDQDLQLRVESNLIHVYPLQRQKGSRTLIVESNIKNSKGRDLPRTESVLVVFEDIKPAVRFTGDGTILPSSQGFRLPFEAVNLSHVDVRVSKIFDDNIIQFFQGNSFAGSSQLDRVGRIVLKKTVPLTLGTPIDPSKWNAFSLDLTQFIAKEPGAIYRVELGFRQEYSLYGCGSSEEDQEGNSRDNEIDTKVITDYKELQEDPYTDPYYYGYPDDYDWGEKDNPCHSSYYTRSRYVEKNVFASDFGIIAKKGMNKEWRFVISDLNTTKPEVGVTIELYDFQQQLITTVSTDAKGMASVKPEREPFLLKASKSSEHGYLKLQDGHSLSLSKYDIAGKRVQEGVKGYLYGERGVWRPGDTLFLTFILEDSEDMIPAGHPVNMRIENPRGQTVYRESQVNNVKGFYKFLYTSEAEGITGTYWAYLEVGGLHFSKPLKIETIKPNRLKIDLDLGDGMLSQGNINGTLKAKWLHGAPARNLRGEVTASFSTAPTTFEGYEDFDFTDGSKYFHSTEQILYEGMLNDQGEAVISEFVDVGEDAPGMLRMQLTTRVFEKGGDASLDFRTKSYSPYGTYVGVKQPERENPWEYLVTDTNYTFEVATVSAEGKPVSRNNLEVRVYKVNWRWWWESGYDNLGRYVSSDYYQPVFTKTIRTSNGKGQFSFRVNYPEWGRYLVWVKDPQSGHTTSTTVHVDWPGWRRKDRDQGNEMATMLMFSADKQEYQVGDYATLNIPTGKKGRALVSLETGSRVLEMHWVDVSSEETTFRFRISEEMAPNVYAHVSYIQPHKDRGNDMPIRMYGAIPLLVNDPATKLAPVIDMPDELAPEKEFTLKVSEKNGKAMTYTVAIVDEGLLDLTNFKTPDPWPEFYAREALGVNTWDMYEDVMGAYGGRIEKAFAIGGGGEGDDGEKKKINRFKPMVRFIGPFHLGAGQTARHSVEMPNYIGSVRTMVVAGYDGAYGNAEKTTPVRTPLMLLATLPRVLGPGEQVSLPVNVFAMEEKVRNVTVTVKTNDLLLLNGSSTQTLVFNEIGDQTLFFDLDVAETVGAGRIEITAKSGNEEAHYEIDIEVRNPNPAITKYKDAVLQKGGSFNYTYQLHGMTGTNEAVLEVSSIPPIDFGRRLKWLLAYPHGCIEQTTSAAFPQLFVDDVMETNETMEAMLNTNIKAAISKIKQHQQPNGGFSYWPGGDGVSDWGTSYAGHFLLEAEKQGYTVPQGMKSAWLKYQQRASREWAPYTSSGDVRYKRSDLLQAYRLYTLALAGEPDKGAMNRLRGRDDLSLQARWRLAAAYALTGEKPTAKELVANAPMNVPEYREMYYSYGSSTRDLAMILETIGLLGEHERGIDLARRISDMLSGDSWMSTQTTAYCLLAMTKYAGADRTSKALKFSYSVNGRNTVNITSPKPVFQYDIDENEGMSGKVNVQNNSEGILFVRMTMRGNPLTGDESEAENNLKMTVSYTDLEGNPLDVGSLEQGTDFLARVSVSNPGMMGYYRQMALTQIFPSGWEIRNTRLAGFDFSYQADRPNYQDIRDDRVYSYFHIGANKQETYVIQLNASYLGKFYLPTLNCEAMYDDRIYAYKPGKWVEVVKRNE